MFPLHQTTEMAFFEHDYATKYSNKQTRLHANALQAAEESFNRRVHPVTNFPVFTPNAIQKVQTEKILWHQHHNTNANAYCEGFQISPNYKREIIQTAENKYLDEADAIYSADSYQAKQLVRGTLEPYLRFHNHERTRHGQDHGKTTHNRPSKTIAKRKSRTVFNTQQILILERIFKQKPYVSREERQILVQMLNVNDRVIKVWFQNRRRLSGVSQRDPEPVGTYSDSSNEDIDTSFNLSYVESKINDADEFGYVTLDERAMNDLITVVDAFLTDIDLNESLNSDIACSVDTIKDVMKYEPISPVSINDYEDDASYMPQWEPNEPEVSLRHLFDVQALMSM